MTTALIFLAVASPFTLIAGLAWAAHRSGALRLRIDQFRMAAPMAGRVFEDDRDISRIAHDLDAIRTRFEQHPAWPSSGALGERR